MALRMQRFVLVGGRHARTWSVILEGAGHRDSGLRASIAKVDTGRVFFFLTYVAGAIFAILDDVPFLDPSYRVLVTRIATGESIGVREARTLRKARQQFAEVENVLDGASEDEAKAALELDF